MWFITTIYWLSLTMEAKPVLKKPSQLVAVNGQRSDPEAVLLKNNGLHVEIPFLIVTAKMA